MGGWCNLALVNPKEELRTVEEYCCGGSLESYDYRFPVDPVVGDVQKEDWACLGWGGQEDNSPPCEGFKVEEEEADVKTSSSLPEFEQGGFSWDRQSCSSSSAASTLNLSLNYQDVLDAWSDRGPLWAADGHSGCPPDASSHSSNYAGEVPSLGDEEEERERRRRAARVRKYREKRHSRLFSRTIRYDVRKRNADQRPRVKGRFVKRNPAESNCPREEMRR